MKKFIILVLLLPAICFAAPVKKWFPGHYTEVGELQDGDLRDLTAAKDVLKGAWLRYNWGSIELSLNKFDFSKIDSDIAKLSSKGFKVGLLLEDKSWMEPIGVKCVPADMVGNATYSGGQLVTPNGNAYTCTAKRWIPKVTERWVAFIAKMGARYDSNPNVVMIQDTESANSTSDYSKIDYVAHLKAEANAFAKAFPTTPWAMSLNWAVPAEDREPLVQLISSLGGGITHPDSIPPNGQGNQFDSYFVSYRGRIVSAPLAEMTYIAGRETLIGTSSAPTWKDHVNFVVNKQGAHFVGWPRFAWGSKITFNFITDLVPALREVPTIKTCPSNIICNTLSATPSTPVNLNLQK